jgi:hypothetical protein
MILLVKWLNNRISPFSFEESMKTWWKKRVFLRLNENRKNINHLTIHISMLLKKRQIKNAFRLFTTRITYLQ